MYEKKRNQTQPKFLKQLKELNSSVLIPCPYTEITNTIIVPEYNVPSFQDQQNLIHIFRAYQQIKKTYLKEGVYIT